MNEVLRQHDRITALIEALEDITWEESQLHNSNSLIFWLPVTSILSEDYWLGLSKSGYWVSELDNHVNLINEKADMRSLLPCLKKTYYELVDLLEQGLKQKKLPLELVQTFPSQTLLLFALKSKSDFWSGLALDWLNHININNEITVELENVSMAPWVTQNTKQKTSKLLKKLKLQSDLLRD